MARIIFLPLKYFQFFGVVVSRLWATMHQVLYRASELINNFHLCRHISIHSAYYVPKNKDGCWVRS